VAESSIGGTVKRPTHSPWPALLFALACGCSTSGQAELDEAQRVIAEVREQTLDLTYEHADYQRALDAFEKVPQNSPQRDQAEIWIERLGEASRKAQDRKLALAEELLAVPDEFPDIRHSVQYAKDRSARSNEYASGAGAPRRNLRARGRGASAPSPRIAATADLDNSGRGKAYWQNRRASLQARVSKMQCRVNKLQSKVRRACVNAMAGCKSRYKRKGVEQGDLADVTYKPDTIHHTDPKNARCAQRREQLAAAQQELEQARKSLNGLSDEARRAGALPGWIR